MRSISILGATGSIGGSTLDVIARHPDRYRVEALTANRDVDAMAALCARFRPALAVMADAGAARALAARLEPGSPTRVAAGAEGLAEAAAGGGADTVVAAIVGAAGLAPTLAAVRAGRRVLLANKEALVVAGALFMAEVAAHGAELLPVDSEHNGVFQCLYASGGAVAGAAGVERILLTASGGPFRERAPETLGAVTPEEACAHPTWSMGRKISVDSATMMNKGLEVIEACWLFAMEPDRVGVVIHPQSLVHALVRYRDGSVLAQLGQPDMRTPIAQALAWPERIDSGVAPLDLMAVGRLDFEAPDLRRFPCLGLAEAALRAGGSAPAALNGANEVAVAAFLEGRLGFTGIAAVIETTLEAMPAGAADSLDDLLAAEGEARRLAGAAVARQRRD
ncbi:1-deoxy-D-xylulose-5-phosphate reductoisomerase [Sediminicurvatus halobius]|uniref:1-deoxy-D-xylulose 5-phosphate reductoisomerase n=1 Tax=Sediminicurvatus halobius TaxID=2182432 RepID=A0A2U2N420_9GAMM|nr:1-deoxy-D-xylulose-5-phosphate reductoisomerase [Spiribacter halobius]PWG63971.1 1-deoxy-D-xylulose-5-phosphate reductoisomerase [Spiribacter halobius]